MLSELSLRAASRSSCVSYPADSRLLCMNVEIGATQPLEISASATDLPEAGVFLSMVFSMDADHPASSLEV